VLPCVDLAAWRRRLCVPGIQSALISKAAPLAMSRAAHLNWASRSPLTTLLSVMPSAPPGLRLLVASDTIWHEGLTRCTTAKVSAHVSCRPVPMRASHVDLGQGPREEEQRLAWSGSLSTYLRARAVADRLPHRPPASQIRTGVRRFSPRHCCTLLLYQTLEPLAQVFELLSLSWCGAMGIRTPDLLHAMPADSVRLCRAESDTGRSGGLQCLAASGLVWCCLMRLSLG
jgi:hypothetical protein